VGWWGPGIFDGDQSQDLYLALVRSLELEALVTRSHPMDPEGYITSPDEWDEETIARLAGVDQLAARVGSWAAGYVERTREQVIEELREAFTLRLPELERDAPEMTSEGGFPVIDALAAVLGSHNPGADPEADRRIIDRLAGELAEASIAELNADARYAQQVAASVLLTVGVPLPEELAGAALEACRNDPWAANNPARQAAVDQLAQAIVSQQSGWKPTGRSMAEAIELSRRAGSVLVNLPGSATPIARDAMPDQDA
jgi:hypothetical protein